MGKDRIITNNRTQIRQVLVNVIGKHNSRLHVFIMKTIVLFIVRLTHFYRMVMKPIGGQKACEMCLVWQRWFVKIAPT
jgi:hypothetical protein